MAIQTLIIGGGIQGATAALALGREGIASTIVEAGDSLLSRASYRNEGKIHLGFVYALDTSGQTVQQMVEGALSFAPLIERWCGPVDWAAMRSEPFSYLVMPDSLAPADELAEHYALVDERIETHSSEFGSNYCGTDPRVPTQRGVGAPPGLDPSSDLAWFTTPEISLDPRALCALLERAVAASPLVEVLTGHRAVEVARTEAGFTVTCDTPADQRRIPAEQVINCAWEGRAQLDAMAGLEPEQLIYRIKHQVIARSDSPLDLAPLTMVQGPYGDIVPWPGADDGGDVYLSWYPSGRTFIGSEPAGSDTPDPAVAEATLSQLREMIPALDSCTVIDHAPAYILAPDTESLGSDISRVDSPLHDRSLMEVAGSERDGWWSLRSHKLTTAPLVSARCVEQVLGGANVLRDEVA